MCAVSAIGDTYKRQFDDMWPKGPIYPYVYAPNEPYGPSKEEFNDLKAKVEEMIAMLKAARQYDILTKQADCAMEEKLAFLRKVAKLVGVDLDKEAFGGGNAKAA